MLFTQNGIAQIDNVSYLPDLGLCNFWQYLALNSSSDGKDMKILEIIWKFSECIQKNKFQ